MVIYSRFGDRFGLEEALAKRAIDSFIDAVQAAPESMSGVGQAIRSWSLEHRSRFSLLFLTGHLMDSTLRPEIDQSIHRAASTIAQQVGWARGRGAGAGLTALAALVGYLTLELREQVPSGTAESGYAALLEALATLAPVS
jgi:AcrR family transcriptional regulator